jgi:hypothetical protein
MQEELANTHTDHEHTPCSPAVRTMPRDVDCHMLHGMYMMRHNAREDLDVIMRLQFRER